MVIDDFIFIIFSYNVKNAKLTVGVDVRRRVTLNGNERSHCLKL